MGDILAPSLVDGLRPGVWRDYHGSIVSGRLKSKKPRLLSSHEINSDDQVSSIAESP